VVAVLALVLLHRLMVRGWPDRAAAREIALALPLAFALAASVAFFHPFYYYPDVDTHGRFLDALRTNPSLLVEYAVAALAVGQAAEVVARLEALDPNGPRHGRFQMLLAEAYVALGRLDDAGAILGSHLVVPDIREGAATFTEVWRAYQAARGTDEPLPAEYDFRMRPDA
jgi:hypothetical protein